MYLLLIGIVIYLIFMFPKVACVVFNPIKVIRYLPIDIYLYFKYKKYNNVPVGCLVALVGLFGKGKTLSAVHIVVSFYMRKNGKLVWCMRRKKMVSQRVKIISNVQLTVPYEKLINLEQVVYASQNNNSYDDEHNTLTVTLVFGDEFSTQMNSRNFKTNINTVLLNTVLTCRHYHIAIYYTAQRFGHVDALLRQVTSYVVDCRKTWRLQGLDYYDAWEMENAVNTMQLKPYKRIAWFVTDKDYGLYDTLACVENLQQMSKNGDLMTDEEILALQVASVPNPDNILKPSRKYRKFRNKNK